MFLCVLNVFSCNFAKTQKRSTFLLSIIRFGLALYKQTLQTHSEVRLHNERFLIFFKEALKVNVNLFQLGGKIT